MKEQPINWCLSWAGTVELGFADGKYLPRAAALILHPEYFKNGEPIMEKLPSDERRLYMTEEQKKRADEIQSEINKIEQTIFQLEHANSFYLKTKAFTIFSLIYGATERKLYFPKTVRERIIDELKEYRKELMDEFANL